jgi:glyoxylase I family protein
VSDNGARHFASREPRHEHLDNAVAIPPRPRGIHHVSFTVSDVARSLDFYIRVLGCKQLPRPEMGFRGAWLQIGVQQIHLMECPTDAGANAALHMNQDPDPRNNHVAIVVDDLIAAKQFLSGQGINFAGGRLEQLRQVFLCDPDGNTLELTALDGSHADPD